MFWSWRIPTFTAMTFVTAVVLVLIGMVVVDCWRCYRLERWARRAEPLLSAPVPEPTRFGPAQRLVEDALALRRSLADGVPLSGEQLRHVGIWMEALDSPPPLTTQALASAGIDPSDTARALRTALDSEEPSHQVALDVMRVLHDFFARLTHGGGALTYR